MISLHWRSRNIIYIHEKIHLNTIRVKNWESSSVGYTFKKGPGFCIAVVFVLKSCSLVMRWTHENGVSHFFTALSVHVRAWHSFVATISVVTLKTFFCFVFLVVFMSVCKQFHETFNTKALLSAWAVNGLRGAALIQENSHLSSNYISFSWLINQLLKSFISRACLVFRVSCSRFSVNLVDK